MKMLRITLEGKSYEVGVELLDATAPAVAAQQLAPAIHQPVSGASVAHPSVAVVDGSTSVSSPMAGNIFKCLVKPGDQVSHNQVVIVLDAMKMETPVVAPLAGTVRSVLVKEGDSVEEGDLLIQLETGS